MQGAQGSSIGILDCTVPVQTSCDEQLELYMTTAKYAASIATIVKFLLFNSKVCKAQDGVDPPV